MCFTRFARIIGEYKALTIGQGELLSGAPSHAATNCQQNRSALTTLVRALALKPRLYLWIEQHHQRPYADGQADDPAERARQQRED